MWPFRRRRKSAGAVDMEQAGPGRHNNGLELGQAPERRKSRRDKKRKSSRDSKKLQRDPEKRRTYSFSPGRNDDIRVGREQNQPPVPPLPAQIKGKPLRAYTEKLESAPAAALPRSKTQPLESIEDWQRMPTLHKRSGQDMARRKSSKKQRKEDHDREKEIKAMVAFMPTRPAAEPNSSGRPMRRESKKARAGFNRNFTNPSSDVSLPLAASLRSSMSGTSGNDASFKVSTFDVLAPRPTIKYSDFPRYVPYTSGYGSDGSGGKRKRVSERVAIPEETLKANKRIDDLADDLNAGELRELMERDGKRKEKKKIADRIKMERRLARRQEKQKVDEATAVRNGTPPPVNMERGVYGREVIGLGIGTSAVLTSSKRKGSISSEGRGKRPADVFHVDPIITAPNPAFRRTESLATENLTPTSEHGDPVIEIAKVGTVAKATISPPGSPKGHRRGASSISQMMELSKPEAPAPSMPRAQTTQQIPEPSTTKQASSWSSFFKIRSRNKRGSVDAPSSFSNTSRDSMHSGQGPQIGYTPMKMKSNIPKRTMSKFREDLPELPMSPPDSRVQSPEADVIAPIQIPRKSGKNSSEDPQARYDTPTSGYRSLDTAGLRDDTPTSGHRTNASPEPVAILSQSLASIDSEGSWLSGRKASSKPGSAQLPSRSIQHSSNSLNRRYNDFSESAEELGIVEDEYFSRLSPGPDDGFKQRKPSTGLPSSDDEEGGSIASPVSDKAKWGAIARTPTVIHHEPRAKSREGLLNEFDDDSESEATGETPTEIYPKERIGESKADHGIHRATSVDLGKKHARHMSAGSARLLDLKPRASGEGRRMSSGSWAAKE